MKKPLSEKILVLGIDGMDPRLTRKYVDQGLMPNTKKIIIGWTAYCYAADVDDISYRMLSNGS